MQREESIDAQVRACKFYAKNQGIEIINIYADKAKTGTTVKRRTEFLQMIEDSKKGNFNVVLVHVLNRFARDGFDTLKYKQELERNGVTLISITEKLDNTPEGRLMLMVIAGMNEFYSANLKSEVMKGLKENAYNGKHTRGKPPLGYDVDKETKMLVINPFESEAVKLIFSMYLDGMTYGQIIMVLNERGFTTKVGQQFGNNSINSILKNPKYAGTFAYGRAKPKDMDGKRSGFKNDNAEDIIKIEGLVPSLVSKEDFDRVQECMKIRKHKAAKHRAKRTYLLSGKIYCGECGSVYVGNCRPERSDHPEYLSYRCNNKTKRPRCKGWEIRLETLESMVLTELSNIVFNDELIPKLADGYHRYLMEQNNDGMITQQSIKAQINKVQKDIDKLVSAILNTSSDSNSLVKKVNELDNQKRELTEQLYKKEANCKIKTLTEEELLHSFTQAREMLKQENYLQ